MGRQVYLTRLALVSTIAFIDRSLLIMYRVAPHMNTLRTLSTLMPRGQENGHPP